MMVSLESAAVSFLLFAISLGVRAQDDDGDDDGESKPKPKKKPSKEESPVAVDSEPEPLYTNEDSGYVWFLVLLLAICTYFAYRSFQYYKKKRQVNNTGNKAKPAGFTKFQLQFLGAYALCVSADWMQGAYVFKLYSFYGLSKTEIGTLFIAGFLSSLLFGTLVAGLADRMGRKRMCLVYCVVYAAACLTKHSKEYNNLLIGRLLSGIATSVLHSGFESFYVTAHHTDFPRTEDWLLETLNHMSFIRSFVAILAAVASNLLVDRYGFISPFDCATVLLFVGFSSIATMWKENYGDRNAAVGASFTRAVTVLATNPRVWLLGFIQACFEGAMYIFVFSWTPLLEHGGGEHLPHGLVFCSFMVSIMIGSNAVSVFSEHVTTTTDESVAQTACAVAFVSMCTVVLFYDTSHRLVFLACCMFECMVGLYFPTMASQRAKHVPNEVRATLLGFFRVPLNLIVVLVLLNAGELGTKRLAMCSAALLALALAGERTLAWMVSSLASGKSSDSEDVAVKAAKA